MSSGYVYPLIGALAGLLGAYISFRYYLYFNGQTFSGLGDQGNNRRLVSQALVFLAISCLVFAGSLFYLFELAKNPIRPATITTTTPRNGAALTATMQSLGSLTPGIPPTSIPTPEISATPGVGFARIGNTNGFGANVRTEPGLNYESLIQLSDGSRVELTGEAQEADGFNWQRVRLDDGRLGWIADKFLIPEK